MTSEDTARLRAYIEYFRDLGVHDFYQRGEASPELRAELAQLLEHARPAAAQNTPARTSSPGARSSQAPTQGSRPGVPQRPSPPQTSAPSAPSLSPFEASRQRAAGIAPQQSAASPFAASSSQKAGSTQPAKPAGISPVIEPPTAPQIDPQLLPPEMPLISLNERIALPDKRVSATDKHSALQSVRHHIGDCTRCPLAYAGRHTIVFADGDPNARLMFVGEGPGADEDASGVPFVGKAGQLLNNMITAMGLKREDVYIANVVKCRPPGNRTPEPVEANTCSQFLAEQIDIVQPEYIVALGATAATYLLGVKKPLTALRGNWFEVRGAKVGVTYHPAYLLRDPNMKGEAWKDLQRVMAAMGLQPPKKA